MAPEKKFAISKEELAHLYLEQWISPKEIAEMKGCSRDLIYHYIQVFGIPKRPRIKNLVGQKRGYLEVLSLAGIGAQGAEWNCKCICGKNVVVQTSKLARKNISCGCMNGEWNKQHGMSRTRPYRIWQGIKSRCTNEKTINYPAYGGRGIVLCKKWLQFPGFWEDMEEGYSKNLTIDRIDVNKGYYKENCRWITYKEQNFNKRTNHIVTFNGETKTVTEWAERFKVDRSRLFYFLKRTGDDLAAALSSL